jgi:hypothetical protein
MDKGQEVLARARATLARLDGIEDEFAADAYKRDNAFERLRHLCPTAPRKQAPEETEQQIMQRNFDAWEDCLDVQLKNFADMIGQEIGESDRAINARLAALEQAVGEMKAEQAVTRAAAEIVELPSFLTKRDGNAAA